MKRLRWECPECGSGDVLIALPYWYREYAPINGGAWELVPEELDEGAAPLYWACGHCYASGDGAPRERYP